ncbi:MAG: hypothetical protein Kow0059_12400 [Candidatus Sumerlaeia bacterium]
MIHDQVGVIPWRRCNNSIEILLITSRSTGRWIVPKGWCEDGLTPAEAAAREGFEEAGVQGKIASEPLGVYEYIRGQTKFRVTLYPLEVVMIWDTWPEHSERRRRWTPVERLDAFVKNPTLLEVLRMLRPALERAAR